MYEIILQQNASTRSLINLSWQSITYGIGILGRQAVLFIVLPVFTNYMTQAEFGVVAVFASSLAFLNQITNAGLPSATFRLYNDYRDALNHHYVLGSSFFLFFSFAAIPAIIMVIAAEKLSQFLFENPNYAIDIRIVAGLLVIETMINYGFILLRVQVRPLATSVLNIVLVLCQVSFAVYFVRYFNLGPTGYFLGYLFGACLALAIMVWSVKDIISFRINWTIFQDLLLYGIPLVPSTLSMWVLRLADRSLIAWYVGFEKVAVYEVGYKIGWLVFLGVTPFNAAWPQFSFSIMHRNSAPKVYRDVLTFITAGWAFLALIVMAFSPELVRAVAPQSYQDAIYIIPWVAVSAVFFGMYFVLSLGLKIEKKTFLLSVVALIAAGMNIGLNIVLLPKIGIVAAAINTFVAYLLLSVLSYIFGQRFFIIPLDWARLVKILIASVSTFIIIIQLGSMSFFDINSIIVRAFGLVSYPILLLLMGFISLNQSKELWKLGTSLIRHRMEKA